MAYPQDKFSFQSVSDCSQLPIILAPESQTDICNLYSQLHCSQEQEMQATPQTTHGGKENKCVQWNF